MRLTASNTTSPPIARAGLNHQGTRVTTLVLVGSVTVLVTITVSALHSACSWIVSNDLITLALTRSVSIKIVSTGKVIATVSTVTLGRYTVSISCTSVLRGVRAFLRALHPVIRGNIPLSKRKALKRAVFSLSIVYLAF